MTRPNPLLYRLLKVALNCTYSKEEVISQLNSFSDKEWGQLFSQSREQAVSGLLYHSFEILQCEDILPDSIAMEWMLNAYQIRKRGESVKNLSHQLCSAMEDQGFHPVILKGPNVAAYYPCPEMRTPGDIDLFLSQEEFQAAKSFLSACYGQERMAPDGSFHYQLKGIDIDLHNSFYDSSFAAPLLPSPPSAEATLFMLSSHILKHAFGPGVGLRQICDLAMAIRALKGDYDAEALVKTFRITRTFRWNRMLFSLIQERIGVDAGLFPSGKFTSFSSLEKIIFTGGNFGHHSASRKKALSFSGSRRKMDTTMCMLRHLPFALRYAPREYFYYLISLLKGNMEKTTIPPTPITETRDALRKQAIDLYQQGKGYKSIASALGMSRDTIRSWIVSYRTTGRTESVHTTEHLRSIPSYQEREERFAAAREEYENSSASLLAIAQKHGLNYNNLRNYLQRDHPESALLHAYAKQSVKMQASMDAQIATLRQLGEEYLDKMREELADQVQRLHSSHPKQ